MKRTISLILSFILLASSLLLSSCIRLGEKYPKNIFPEGYTGGIGIDPGSSVEYYWVETYEEALAAIKLLMSHESSFSDFCIFDCNSDLFDVKYCFTFPGNYTHNKEKVKYGDNPYDRWATNVTVHTYVFFEDTTIDEIAFSLLKEYDAYYVKANSGYAKLRDDIDVKSLQIGEWTFKNKHERCVYNDGEEIMTISSCFFGEKEIKMTDECIKAILASEKYFSFE